VLLYEIPVRVHLKQGLFTVRFEEHLVIPLTIGIVFSSTLTMFPPAAFSLIVFWTEAGSDFRSTVFHQKLSACQPLQSCNDCVIPSGRLGPR
jgi:hypothetical protein